MRKGAHLKNSNDKVTTSLMLPKDDFHQIISIYQTLIGAAKVFAAIVSAVVVILILLGYGVTIAVEDQFVLPNGSTYEGTLDLINLGSKYAVIPIFIKIMAGWNKEKIYTSFFSEEYYLPVWGLSIIVSTLFLIYGLWSYFHLKAPSTYFDSTKLWIKRRFRLTIEWMAYLSLILSFNLAPVIMIVATAVIRFLITLTLLGLISLPYIGETRSSEFIKENVIYPSRCKAIAFIKQNQEKNTQSSNESINYSDCVAVFTNGKTFSGRVVISTSKSIVLYNPDTGQAQRVPIDGALIETISELPKKKS